MTQTICAYAQFTKTLVGVNSLTVTWDVERITRADGTRNALVTGGANGVTVGRRGLYGYVLTGADLLTYDYLFTAITAGDVDLKEVPAVWVEYSITSPTAADIATAVWSAVTRTLTAGGFAAADVWAYAVRTLTQSAAAVQSAMTGTALSIQRGDSFSVTFTGLPANTGYVSIDFTVKSSRADADTESIICVRKNASGVGDGLLYLDGYVPHAPVTAADGSITVVSATSITVALSAAAGLSYDVQYVFATTVQTATEGVCNVTADVRRAIV
jgi:hypothetical protein